MTLPIKLTGLACIVISLSGCSNSRKPLPESIVLSDHKALEIPPSFDIDEIAARPAKPKAIPGLSKAEQTLVSTLDATHKPESKQQLELQVTEK